MSASFETFLVDGTSADIGLSVDRRGRRPGRRRSAEDQVVVEGPSTQDKSDRRARIEFFVEQISARSPGQIAEIVSYGSVARGEDGPFSDIELFCVVDRLLASKVKADWAVSQGQFVYARCITGDPALVDELKHIVLSASDDDIAGAIKETTVGELPETERVIEAVEAAWSGIITWETERGVELSVRSWPP